LLKEDFHRVPCAFPIWPMIGQSPLMLEA